MNLKRRLTIISLIGVLLISAVLSLPRIGAFRRVMNMLQGKKTVEDRLRQYGPDARVRLGDFFKAKGISYPPEHATFLVLKQEKMLQLYVPKDKKMILVHEYPVLAASGRNGPKLREGDCQVPEGIYRITFLNPNSLYHLSMRLDYPNEFDQAMAKVDGRDKLGGDIMIHGDQVSIGCVAVGDQASEDLFVLAADIGMENVEVIIAPHEFRNKQRENVAKDVPKWTGDLYNEIEQKMVKLTR